MRLMKRLGIALLFSALAVAQTPGPVPASTPESQNLSLSFSIHGMDTTADPCNDFYQYACGTWLKENEIPADKVAWSRYNGVAERNRDILHNIAEKVSQNDPKRTPIEQKIGDYYASCVDQETIEKKGLTPIQPELDRLARLKDKSQLAAEVAHLHMLDVGGLFSFGVEADDRNANKTILWIDQAGLGLPDRDYYFKDDPASEQLRQQYKQHIQNMFQLLGDKPEMATKEAQTVFEIETALAAASMKTADRRDPAKTYHMMSTAELAKLSPAFDWNKYIAALDAPPFKALNVAAPDFFKSLEELIEKRPLENWKTYLRWNLVNAHPDLLSRKFDEEYFDFYHRKLRGQKEMGPRSERCSGFTSFALDDAVGQLFVERTFGKEGKERTLKMIHALEKALAYDIEGLDWMSDTTKQEALAKLAAVTNKIGYPDKWRDYSSLKIVRGDFFGNFLRANSFRFRYNLSKIGKDVDKTEWRLSPTELNASYSPEQNDITFPAGRLQPPFFDNRMDDAVNFGAIGAVIGHELTHGFDDEGRKFDAHGNLRDWWTPEDEKAFNQRARCLAEEYSGFVSLKDDKDPRNDVHVNGNLTLGENIADNGGLRIAYTALMHASAETVPAKIDGFTPAQRFFLSYGQSRCLKMTPEFTRQLALTDAHSPGRFRVNGVVSNMPEFQQAFSCKKGDAMVRENACRLW